MVRIITLPNVHRGSHLTDKTTDDQFNAERKDGGNILTASKDGIICFWKGASNLRLHKTINVSNYTLNACRAIYM